MLHLAAYSYGDIVGKSVLDLGCGTGRLALGAAFLGARSIVGVDVDKAAVKAARRNATTAGLKTAVGWVAGDIDAVAGTFDTVLQNPPFGVQTRGADRKFLAKALEVGRVVYSLHNHPYSDDELLGRLKANSAIQLRIPPSPFIERFVEARGGKIETVYALPLAIPRMFDFHTRVKRTVVVDLYVIRQCG